jgi:hypothetical protein
LESVRNGVKEWTLPEGSSESVALTVRECTSFDPKQRPPFMELERRFGCIDNTQFTSPAFEQDGNICRIACTGSQAVRRGSSQGGQATTYLGQKSRSASILSDLFPQHVTQALLRGEKVPPEKKEMITMYFRYVQEIISANAYSHLAL